MQLSQELQDLLAKEVPSMPDQGRQHFELLMEQAVSSVVRRAFTQDYLDAYHVTRMVR